MRGRVHTREFKLQVVRAVATGTKRPAQVCREHQLANSVLDRWRHEYRERGEDAFTPRPADLDATGQRRMAELERLCGQLTVENALLKKLLASTPSRHGTR
jgi:transposase